MELYPLYFLGGGTEQALTLVSTLVLWLGLSVLGSVAAGPDRVREGSFVYGWGLAALAVTAGQVLVGLPLSNGSLVLAFLVALSAVFLVRRRESPLPPGLAKVVLLGLPLLLIASAMEPSQWDEFSHWLPAPRFLLQTDAFPSDANPVTGTPMLPAYPYNWPLLTYWASLPGGRLLEGVPRLVDLLLLMSIGLIALRLARQAAGQDDVGSVGWKAAALALMAATLLNPSFIQKIVLTAYADVSTATLTALGAYLGWRMLNALARDDDGEAKSLAWQFGLAALALINIKQVNLVHFAVVLAGIGLAGLRDPRVRILDLARRAPAMVVLPLVAYAMWRWYVSTQMTGFNVTEATFMPFEQWNIGVIPGILAQMMVVAFKKIGYFGIMFVAVGFAVKGLWRFRGEFDRLSIIAATAFLGYTAFMLLTYVASFAEADALRVVSFWRYSSHMALVAVLFAAYGAGLLWRRYMETRTLFKGVAALPIVLVLIAPVLFAHKLRFDFEVPKPRFNAAAHFLQENLPPDRGLRVLDPLGNGESSVVTRYRVDRNTIPFSTYRTLKTLDDIRRFVAPVSDGDWLLIHSVLPGMNQLFGLDLEDKTSYLLVRRRDGWEMLRAWHFDDRIRTWTPGEKKAMVTS